MAGLVPAIHVFFHAPPQDVDARTSPGMTLSLLIVGREAESHAWLATALPSAACAAASRAIGTR
ncbi:hypothetical protein SAMN05443248_1529 [Bradyrhizobium erythrophlei]|jgi:hypothetical protein|uniref:Uncharacterized protein n=1 Tax=Bradyrhizobium erythrophlei TaxID=1437360 RepID=A0A1M5JQH5_9BRAD|nr:hypothetical protein SAMN05443248_1529 [Bradyrhizobium erythrophlei]